MKQYPSIIFASPNIPNPEVYLSIIPDMQSTEIHKLASKYTPVCQFKYFIDLLDGVGYQYNDYAQRFTNLSFDFSGYQLNDLINSAGAGNKNIVCWKIDSFNQSTRTEYSSQYPFFKTSFNTQSYITRQIANMIRNTSHYQVR